MVGNVVLGASGTGLGGSAVGEGAGAGGVVGCAAVGLFVGLGLLGSFAAGSVGVGVGAGGFCAKALPEMLNAPTASRVQSVRLPNWITSYSSLEVLVSP
jgi:hypothetical protein